MIDNARAGRGTRLRRVRGRGAARTAVHLLRPDRGAEPHRRPDQRTSGCSPRSRRCRLLDPVRAFEDYATLDHLSGGRLELIIGKGNGAAQRDLFHVTPEDQWDRNAESYEVFRRLWRDNKITYETKFRPPLTEAEVWPRPLQHPIRVWHGSATSRGVGRPGRAVRRPAVLGQRHQPDRALRGTDPLLPRAVGRTTGTIRRRSRSARGRPATTPTRNSQDAINAYRPVFARLPGASRRGSASQPVFATLEDFVERSVGADRQPGSR